MCFKRNGYITNEKQKTKIINTLFDGLSNGKVQKRIHQYLDEIISGWMRQSFSTNKDVSIDHHIINILLIGGEGYIGNVISEKLLLDGYSVTSFDNLLYKNNCHLIDE